MFKFIRIPFTGIIEKSSGKDSPDSTIEVEIKSTNGRDRDEEDTSSCECDQRLSQECSPDYRTIITI
ncbi:phosphoinositide phospholipase C 6-like, partial [Trifolium medium]|nr:phosphoinositide phospholipase C 6-like [Trifolium medium]